MNKFLLNIIFLLSLCFTNINSDYIFFNSDVKDHHCIGFNSSYLNNENTKFMISFNTQAKFTNNSLTLDWVNNSLLSGINLENENDKSNFLSIFNEENISLSPMIQSQFAFSYMNYSLSFTPQSFGNILLPYSIIDMAFYGLNFDKDISLDTDKSHFQAVLPITFSHSRNIDKYVSNFNIPFKNIRAGVSTKILMGLALFETQFTNSVIDSDDDNIKIKGDIKSTYSLFDGVYIISEIDSISSSFEFGSDFGFSGSGLALDFGISGDYSDNINVGLSFNNIFGTVAWKSSTYEYNMSYELNISSDQLEEISDYDEVQKDSLNSSIITSESNTAVSQTNTTPYPSYMLLNGNYQYKDFSAASHILVPFNDIYYKNIQFSAGTAYNKFKKLPLFFWINFDGLDHINWYSGFGLRFKNYDFNFGISQVDGFLNSSKGLSVGLSHSFKF